MKKNFIRFAILAFFLIPESLAHGQIIKKSDLKLKPAVRSTIGSTYNSSPDLHHQHEGEHCVSDALTNRWIQDYGIEEQYKAEQAHGNALAAEMDGSERATYTVPIIFHVVHNPNNPAENVSEAAINNLLDAVNDEFSASNPDIGNLRTGFGWYGANANIEFCLAQKNPYGQQLVELGIHRVVTTENYFNPDTESNKMKSNTGGNTGTPGWDRNKYLNVWICDITNGANYGTAGYSYKPTVSSLPPASIDGVVIDYNLGMYPPGSVLTHEIGHYLGLSHTWGNSNQASGCSQDDGLSDTPLTAGPSFNYSGSCQGSQSTCPGVQTQYENFMDYSSCTIIYTQNQANLMAAVLSNSRSSLLTSNACVPVNPQPPNADFVADITSVVAGGIINFTDLSVNYPTGWTWTITPAAGELYQGGTNLNSENPIIQFPTAGTYTVQLNASNAYGNNNEIKTNYISVLSSSGGSSVCDTSRNYTPAEGANMTAYSLTSGAGYYPGTLFAPSGTNIYQLEFVADSFFSAVPTEVRRIRLPIFQADDMGAANNVIFTVWNDGPATGGPGTVAGTETVPIANLNGGFWNEIDFTTPVPVSGEYWVGAQFEYNNTTIEDTVILATTNLSDRPSGPSSTWMRGWEPSLNLPYNWQSTTAFFSSNPDCSLILDVLTSTGPAPTALASWPPPTTCAGMNVTMNGFGSANTTSYYWAISDGTDNFFSNQGNLTTSFTAGNWTISLEADASCKTDVDGPFNLTVNPAMSATFANADENCIAADGVIDITITGGDSGPYNYSINNGTTVETTGTYTGLITGSYNYILTDNNNCELKGTTTVGNTNSFAPTITPDITIAPSTLTALTVTGGVSWIWYGDEGGGPIQIGNTQTINVDPVSTTTYSCNVTDGSGCEAELYVTVTTTLGIEDGSLVNAIDLYPNPAEGEFSLIFKLNEPRDVNIEILNLIGEQVFSNRFMQLKDQTVDFDLNSMAAGVYFITIQSGEEKVSKKIILR